jgi:hypothetical protein
MTLIKNHCYKYHFFNDCIKSLKNVLLFYIFLNSNKKITKNITQ